jgi:hypothetical protein
MDVSGELAEELLATTLAQRKRQEDTLGHCEGLDTVVAQHKIVHHLLVGGCPAGLRKPLSLVDTARVHRGGG